MEWGIICLMCDACKTFNGKGPYIYVVIYIKYVVQSSHFKAGKTEVY